MHVRKEYPTVQLNGWKLWPAAAMFNYRYIPLNLRVLFLNLVALGWYASLELTHVVAAALKSILYISVEQSECF